MACRGVACELLMLSLCIWCQQRRNCGSVQGNQEMNPRMEKRLLSWHRSKPDRTGRKMSQRHCTKVLFETGRRSHTTILLTGHLLRNSSVNWSALHEALVKFLWVSNLLTVNMRLLFMWHLIWSHGSCFHIAGPFRPPQGLGVRESRLDLFKCGVFFRIVPWSSPSNHPKWVIWEKIWMELLQSLKSKFLNVFSAKGERRFSNFHEK